jgi:adenosylmethionine-8-amino-7-oxononanoate aminotransferase
VRRDEKRLIAAAAYCGPLGNTIYVMPPYCVREDDRDEIYAAIEEAPYALPARKLTHPQNGKP